MSRPARKAASGFQVKILGTALVAAVTGALLHGLASSRPDAGGPTPAEIDSRIARWVAENPEEILNSFRAYQEQIQSQSRVPVEDRLQERIEDETIGLAVPIAGPDEPALTVVKFNDPNCGYCRKSVEMLEEVAARVSDVRIVVRPFPILGRDSYAAAQIAWALDRQGLYGAWYEALDDQVGKLGETQAIAQARALGADMQALDRDRLSAEAVKTLNVNLQLGKELGVRGTPTFLVDGRIVRGAIPAAGMLREIENARRARAQRPE